MFPFLSHLPGEPHLDCNQQVGGDSDVWTHLETVMFGLTWREVCCKTNSLWPGIIIHFLNNLYSVALEIMTEYMQSEELLNTLDRVFETAVITIGVLCAVYLFFKFKNTKLNKSNTIIGAGEKTSSLILNAPMIISLIIMLIITS